MCPTTPFLPTTTTLTIMQRQPATPNPAVAPTPAPIPAVVNIDAQVSTRGVQNEGTSTHTLPITATVAVEHRDGGSPKRGHAAHSEAANHPAAARPRRCSSQSWHSVQRRVGRQRRRRTRR